MTQISIIMLDESRWAEYRELRLDALRSDPAAFSSRLLESEARRPDWWQGRLRRAQQRATEWLWFAECDGHVIGMVGAMIKERPDEAEIISMWVHPNYRGFGVGAALLQRQLEALHTDRPELARAVLTVKRGQLLARRLYVAAGFESSEILDEGIRLKMVRNL